MTWIDKMSNSILYGQADGLHVSIQFTPRCAGFPSQQIILYVTLHCFGVFALEFRVWCFVGHSFCGFYFGKGNRGGEYSCSGSRSLPYDISFGQTGYRIRLRHCPAPPVPKFVCVDACSSPPLSLSPLSQTRPNTTLPLSLFLSLPWSTPTLRSTTRNSGNAGN